MESSNNGRTISPFTTHFSQINRLFKGNWLVNYDPKEFEYPAILIDLANISDYFNENRINFNSINIIFNKTSIKNYFFKVKDTILLIFSGIEKGFEEKEAKPWAAAILKPLAKPIRTVSLLFPRLESDPRWKSMGMPAGQLFLAANLEANGFAAQAMTISLPGENPPPEALLSDMTGISLFEDLLPLLGPFLARFRASGTAILAAGGPFPTLAPLAAMYHLPQVDLWVRGEAELALPGIIQALNSGDAGALFANQGVFWRQPGVIAMAGFDRVNRPEDFGNLTFSLDFFGAEDMARGLEMNFSRGCRRGCVFCCRAQGAKFRKLPLEKVEELLEEYKKRVENLNDGEKSPRSIFEIKGLMNQTPTNGDPKKSGERIMGTARRAPTEKSNGRDDRAPTLARYTVNINDDDILQDPDYAGTIFSLIKKHGFRIFGIQTSPESFFGHDRLPAEKVLELASDPELFVAGRPLLWLGTDVFLPGRARRLGKRLPPPAAFARLLAEFEKREVRHFHYWISSDGDSDWREFADELAAIFGFFRRFPGFGLLAHAPFTVPYPASRMFARLEAGDPRLKLKLDLEAADPRFRCQVVERLETRWPNLNRLLLNEKAGGEKGFFDFLKEKDFMAAAQLAYYFLKQEELQGTDKLCEAKEKLEEIIVKSLD